MNGWAPNDYKLGNLLPFSGIVTNSVLTKEFPITASGARHMVLKINVSAVTNVGTQTLKLQTAIGNDWVDSKSATFTADGNVYIKLLAEASGDQTHLPLLNKGRVVLSQTNGGDAATVNSVEVLQEL